MRQKKNLSVFLVDDDPICREIYQQYLLNLGFSNISMYDNGQDCINDLDKAPDIILLDHHMEPIDGLETLREIKRINPDIYLVFVSAQEDMRVTINALKYGAFDYIIKGEREEEMINTVMMKLVNVIDMLSKGPQNVSRFLSFFTL